MLEVERAAQLLGDLDWLSALLVAGSITAVPDPVWAAVLGEIDAAEREPGLGAVIVGLRLNELLTSVAVSQASVNPSILATRIDNAIARIETWIEETFGLWQTSEIRRRQSEGMTAMLDRAVAAPHGPHTVDVELVLCIDRNNAAMTNISLVADAIEAALEFNGEYVGFDHRVGTEVLQIHLLGSNISAMMSAILPTIERFAKPGSYYTWRPTEAPHGTPPVRVEL